MGRYRKKPVVIEAVQFSNKITDWDNREVVTAFFGDFKGWRVNLTNHAPCLEIDTLEGTMKCSSGDWIIKGVNGEFYPCKPDIFEKTYEPDTAPLPGVEVKNG